MTLAKNFAINMPVTDGPMMPKGPLTTEIRAALEIAKGDHVRVIAVVKAVCERLTSVNGQEVTEVNSATVGGVEPESQVTLTYTGTSGLVQAVVTLAAITSLSEGDTELVGNSQIQ